MCQRFATTALTMSELATRAIIVLVTAAAAASIARALPPGDTRLEDEAATLAFAVDAIFDVSFAARATQQ